MWKLSSLLLLFASVASAAEPVFMPDFTPATPQEYTLAAMLQGQVGDRLMADGYMLLTNEVVEPVTGTEAVRSCSLRPGCPAEVLPRLPTRVAVVVRVGRMENTLVGRFEIWEQGQNAPVIERDVAIAPGQEHLFAQDISVATAFVVEKIGPSPDPTLMAAARLIAGQGAAPPPGGAAAPPAQAQLPPAAAPSHPAPQPVPPPPHATHPQPGPHPPQHTGHPPQPGSPPQHAGHPPQPPAHAGYPPQPPAHAGHPPQPPQTAPGEPPRAAPGAAPRVAGAPPQSAPGQPPRRQGDSVLPARSHGAVQHFDPDAPLATILADTGVRPRHVLGSEAHLRKLQLDPRDWVFKATPHAGRFLFEVRLGLGMGDVDRQGDMRVELVGNEPRDRWFQEGPLPARRPQGAIYFGYAPVTMVDIGVLAGFQYGKRNISTGYARVGNSAIDEQATDPRNVDAVQFNVQPRLRTYLVAVGPAKPYLVAGADFRIFNDYNLEQPPNFEYPLPPGGVVPGFAGGGGLLIDPSPIVGFFFEGLYTHHFGPRAAAYESGIWTYRKPELRAGLSYTIGLVGGVQFRI